MQPAEYTRVHALEGCHWWYRTLHRSIQVLTARHAKPPGRLVDAGCGSGGIRQWLPDYAYAGLDCSLDALALLPRQHGIRGSVEQIPIGADRADVLLSVDVLYHAWVTSCSSAASEAFRILKPGGLAIFHVPAISLLASDHDRVVMGLRRFSRSQLVKILERAGFLTEYASYQFSYLVPFAFVARIVKRKGSRLRSHGRILSIVLAAIGAAETRLLQRSIPLPIGTSVIVVVRKPYQTTPATS